MRTLTRLSPTRVRTDHSNPTRWCWMRATGRRCTAWCGADGPSRSRAAYRNRCTAASGVGAVLAPGRPCVNQSAHARHSALSLGTKRPGAASPKALGARLEVVRFLVTRTALHGGYLGRANNTLHHNLRLCGWPHSSLTKPRSSGFVVRNGVVAVRMPTPPGWRSPRRTCRRWRRSRAQLRCSRGGIGRP
jgi:hypothetical protein